MVKEKIHPVTGEKYIEGSQKIIMESGVLLTPSEFSQSTMMSKEEVGALMQELAGREDRYKFDYRYALSTGVLRHKAELPVQKPKEEAEAEKVSEPVVKKNLITPAFLILCVMAVVGTMSAVMSAYHTTTANMIFGRPMIVGLVTGTVMVLFSATAFTAARWFMSEEGPVRLFAAVFLLLGTLVIAYSMLSTLVVSYNAWSKTEEAEKAVTVSNSAELAALDYQVKLKEGELTEAQEAERKISEEAEYWKAKSWKRYDELEGQLTEVRNKITAVRKELAELIAKKPSVTSKAGEEKEDVFSFLSTFIKVKPRTLRLFMQAVPAMFFDIIAPFALSCAIYLAEKRNKKENNDE